MYTFFDTFFAAHEPVAVLQGAFPLRLESTWLVAETVNTETERDILRHKTLFMFHMK